ncbi:MAG: oligosaccharide flippase family protein [Candidatus Omnitrophota bacterium]|nr:oligosaccharide flippase family protein [Candidatus Omnitrophota bacterium]
MTKQSSAQGVLWESTAQTANVLSLYFIHIYIARKLGASAYGVFGVLLSVLLWMRLFLEWGLPNATTKYLLDDTYSSRNAFKKTLTLHLGLSLIAGAVLFIFAPALAEYTKEPELTRYFRILAIDMPLYGTAIYLYRLLQTFRYFRSSAIIIFIVVGLRLTFVIVAISMDLGLYGVSMAYVATSLTSCLCLIPFLKPLPFCIDSQKGHDLPYGVLLRFAGFQMAFVVLFQLIPTINLMHAKRFIAEASMVGHYVAVGTLSKAPHSVFVFTLSLIMLTALTEAFAANKQDLIQHYFKQTVRLLMVVLLPYGVLLGLEGRPIIERLYAQDFGAGAAWFLPYYIGFLGLTAIFIMSIFYQAKAQPERSFYAAFALVISQIVLSWWLIPKYGAYGAAQAMMATGVLALLIFVLQFIRDFGLSFPPGTLVKFATVNIALFGVMVAASAAGLPLWSRLAVAGITYAALLWRLKLVTTEDLRKFTRAS